MSVGAARKSVRATGSPLFGGDLPDLRRKAAGNVVALLNGDDAHALFLGNAARCGVWGRLWDPHHGEFQRFEPVVRDLLHGFRHQSLPLPGKPNPESAIVVAAPHQADTSYYKFGGRLQSQRPLPLVAALNRGQDDIAKMRQGSIRRI